MAETSAEAVAHVLEAMDRLEVVGETVGDDAQYVLDVARAWRVTLGKAAERGQTLTQEQVRAVELAVAEASAVSDPHRAIDWLSTLPQLTLLALEAG